MFQRKRAVLCGEKVHQLKPNKPRCHVGSIRCFFRNPQQLLGYQSWELPDLKIPALRSVCQLGLYLSPAQRMGGPPSRLQQGLSRQGWYLWAAEGDCRGGVRTRAIMETQLRWEGRGFFPCFCLFNKQGDFLGGLNISCPATGLRSAVPYCSVSATDLEAFTQMEISYGKESSLWFLLWWVFFF